MTKVKNPKEFLENLDTVEVVGCHYENHNGNYVVLGETFKRDCDREYSELSEFDDNLIEKQCGNVKINKITDKNGNVKWERELKNHEVGNSVKWHEALLMAASGTPMHIKKANDYMMLNDNNELAWFDKKTNEENSEVKVYKANHWMNEWVPYTPKKMVVDWTKVPADTEVYIKHFEDGTRHKRKFKAFVNEKVFVDSDKKDVLCSWAFTELAEPNDDYTKDAE